jgi:hypothetical protein
MPSSTGNRVIVGAGVEERAMVAQIDRPNLGMLLAPLLASGMLLGATLGWARAPAGDAETQTAASEAAGQWHARQSLLVQRKWGIDIVGVRLVSSGWMLEFRYRVLDPDKAAALRKKEVRPYLIDQASGARLAVPAMENVGELRQTAKLEASKQYYILFGNANKLVKRGARVDVVAGAFNAEGLVVQ